MKSAPWDPRVLRVTCDECGGVVVHGTFAELRPVMDVRAALELRDLLAEIGQDAGPNPSCWWCPKCSNLGVFGPVESEGF